MAKMMEAMISMKKIIEVNAVAVAVTSVVAKVNPIPPSGLNQIIHPNLDMVGQRGKELESTSTPPPPILCKFKTSIPSRHMACLPIIHHSMWCTLLMRMSITPLPYSLRASNLNLIMHISKFG